VGVTAKPFKSSTFKGSRFKACPERNEGSFLARMTDPSKLRMREARTLNFEPFDETQGKLLNFERLLPTTFDWTICRVPV
jgi:hypothetical protein